MFSWRISDKKKSVLSGFMDTTRESIGHERKMKLTDLFFSFQRDPFKLHTTHNNGVFGIMKAIIIKKYYTVVTIRNLDGHNQKSR